MLAERAATLNAQVHAPRLASRAARRSASSSLPRPPVARIGPWTGTGSSGYLLFVWSVGRLQLVEQPGEPPQVGAEIEDGERRYRVTKIAPSPLPGDARRCAYLLPVLSAHSSGSLWTSFSSAYLSTSGLIFAGSGNA